MRFQCFAPAFLVLLSALASANDGLARFSELLVSVRSGTDADLAEFTRVADELAHDLEREDIRAVADYYVNLNAEDRAQGLRDYGLFAEIWNHVLNLSEDGIRGDEWREERQAVLLELHELAQTVEERADFVPAARAFSLAARIETEILVLAATEPGRLELLFDQAGQDAKRAIELFKRSGQLRPQLEPLCTLARLERVRHEHLKSNALFNECLQLAVEVADTDYQEKALQGLASLARRDGNLLALDRFLLKLAALKPPFENWPLTWRQAERLIHVDQPRRALTFLEHNPPRSSSNQSVWHVLRANAFTRLGDWDAARREIKASGDNPLRLALIDIGQQQYELALGRLSGPLPPSLDQRNAPLWFMTRGEALLALDRLPEALHEFEESLQLSRQLETRLAMDQGEAEGRSNIMGEVVGLHGPQLYAEALARDGRTLEAAQVIEEAQARRLRDGEPELDLRAWADHYEVGLITWVIGADRSLRVEVPAQGAANSYALIRRGRVEVARAVRRLREALCDGRLDRAREVGSELVREFFSNVDTKAGRVLLLLHGPLEGLPVEWLIESGLLDANWTPVVLPGLPSTTPLKPRAASGWTLLGAPNATGEAPLLAAAEELRELGALRPNAKILRGDEFDREGLLDALSRGSGVHIATHLVQVDNGLSRESRLVLSNGASLGPDDIRAVKPNLELCVLATCESGGGRLEDAEGAQGIAQAFLESGTRNLIVTTWPVSDKATRVFSRALHEALLDGATPSRATAGARAALRDSGFAPADWAAFRSLGRD